MKKELTLFILLFHFAAWLWWPVVKRLKRVLQYKKLSPLLGRGIRRL